MAKLSPL